MGPESLWPTSESWEKGWVEVRGRVSQHLHSLLARMVMVMKLFILGRDLRGKEPGSSVCLSRPATCGSWPCSSSEASHPRVNTTSMPGFCCPLPCD